MATNNITYSQPNKQPTRKVTAAGVGGIVLGVPVATPLASVLMGVVKATAPNIYEALASVPGFQSGLASLFAVSIAVAAAYLTKERA